MFDENFKSRYKNIKAPDELYDRIEQSCRSMKADKKKTVPFKRITAVAAVLVLTVISGIFLTVSNSMPTVYVDGEKLQGKTVLSKSDESTVMLARADGAFECELQLRIKKETVITAENGELRSKNGEILLLEGESDTFDGNISFVWAVFYENTDKVCLLKLCDDEKTYYLELSFDDVNSSPVLELKS